MSEALIADLKDEYGRVLIAFDETINRPGRIQVDGDVYSGGPVAILNFDFTSEKGAYLETLDNEIDFGTFRVAIQGEAKLSTNVTLTKQQVEILIAALQYQIRPEE